MKPKFDFTQWKSYYLQKGMGLTNPIPNKIDPLQLTLAYYFTYIFPIFYLSSDVCQLYKKFYKEHLIAPVQKKYKNVQEANDSCEGIIKRFFTNEVINPVKVQDRLTKNLRGYGWLYSLEVIVSQFSPSLDLAKREENLTSVFDTIDKYFTLARAWNGGQSDEDYFILRANSGNKLLSGPIPPEVVYPNTCPEDLTFKSLTDLSKNLDSANIIVLRTIVKENPDCTHLIPTVEVDNLVSENFERTEVLLTDLGLNNNPPIEALNIFKIIPSAEKNYYKSIASAIAFHEELGHTLPDVVAHWLHSDVIQQYIAKDTALSSNKNKVTLTPSPQQTATSEEEKFNFAEIPNATEPLLNQESVIDSSDEINALKQRLASMSELNAELTMKLNKKDSAIKKLQEKYNKLLGTQDSFNTQIQSVNEHINLLQQNHQKELADKDEIIRQLQEHIKELEETIKHLQSECDAHRLTDTFWKLLENDYYFPLFVEFISLMRSYTYDNDSIEVRRELMYIYNIFERLCSIGDRESKQELQSFITSYRRFKGDHIATIITKLEDFIINRM